MAAKKAVVKKVAKKTTVKKVATPKAPSLDLARSQLAHAACVAADLVIGDMVGVIDWHFGVEDQPGYPVSEWDAIEGNSVTFKGVQANGLVRVEYDDCDYSIPYEALDWNSIYRDRDAIYAEPVRVTLNSSYVAVVSQKDVVKTAMVQVGCQQIPVAAIRKVLAEIDRVEKLPRKAGVRTKTAAASRTASGVYTTLIAPK